MPVLGYFMMISSEANRHGTSMFGPAGVSHISCTTVHDDRYISIWKHMGVGTNPITLQTNKETKTKDVSLARLRGTVGGEPDSDE